RLRRASAPASPLRARRGRGTDRPGGTWRQRYRRAARSSGSRASSLPRMRRCSAWLRATACSVLIVASGAVGSVVVTAHPAAAAVAHDNEVFAFGSATFQGSTSALALSRPIVAMATTADGTGYWLVAADGGIFSFNAPFYGALAGWPLAQPVVGMTATPTGHGYWIVTGDGAVFPFGDARLYGSM